MLWQAPPLLLLLLLLLPPLVLPLPLPLAWVPGVCGRWEEEQVRYCCAFGHGRTCDGGRRGKEAETRAARDNTTLETSTLARHSPFPPFLRLPRVLPLLGRYIGQEGGLYLSFWSLPACLASASTNACDDRR